MRRQKITKAALATKLRITRTAIYRALRMQTAFDIAEALRHEGKIKVKP